MKLIVGLGNPGRPYAQTRHNAGFRVVDRLARRWQIGLTRQKFSAQMGDGTIAGHHVILLKPTTWMNRSGQAVAEASRFYKLALEDLLVISDDLDLPIGRIRLRAGGSAGGHKGLADIIACLGTDEFARLRVGIGRPDDGDAVDYVLSPFRPEQLAIAQQAEARAAEAAETWTAQGIQAAMNKYNAANDLADTGQASRNPTSGGTNP